MCLLGNAKGNVRPLTSIFPSAKKLPTSTATGCLTKRYIRNVMYEQTALTKQQVYFGKYAHSLTPEAGTPNHPNRNTVALGCIPYLWPVEHILYRKHGDYCQHFLTASQMYRHDQHLAQHRLQGEFCHLQETCFRVLATSWKNLEFSPCKREQMSFLLCFLSKPVCFTQNNFAQHEANYLSIFTITRISQYLQKFLDINKSNLMNKEKNSCFLKKQKVCNYGK